MNVLFIGNSYTYYNDLEVLFEQLCRENGKDVHAWRVTKGGRKMISYTDPEDATTQELTLALQQRQYDVCFLQEHSLQPILDYEAFAAGMSHVCEMLTSQHPKLHLYATWARKAGCEVLDEYGWTTDFMTEQLDAAYRKLGALLNAAVSPVGRNFQTVLRMDPSIDLHNPDLSHPSFEGSCLAALTHYHTLFGTFPESLTSLALHTKVLAVFRRAVCEYAFA